MSRFFVDMVLPESGCVTLPENVVRHLQVLRYRENEHITLFNGNGNDYSARISELSKRSAAVEILSSVSVENESPLYIHLMMSMISNDKMDLVIQKAVELGVNKITPLMTERTQRIKVDKFVARVDHWQKIIIAASEQSGRASLATIVEPQEFKTLLASVNESEKYILSPHHVAEGSSCKNSGKSLVLLVGPEGGFTEDEVRVANSYGFRSLLIGKRILRAETAAIAGISLLQHKFGDF